MISFLRGKILNKSNNYFIIDVNNIGYQVFAGENFLADLRLGSELEVSTYQNVREDALELYGFKKLEDLELYELLLTVSGVGPKTALGIFSVATSGDIKEAVARGDSTLLTKVSGVGKKTAERVVLELRDKIGKLNFYDKLSGEKSVPSSDEIDALMALGYSLAEAREALRGIDANIKDSGERVREALKSMKK